jgi:CheY-like chemotaxis protein/HPt (histidine-containing phosphotransfer) domain-containing protein
MLGCAGSDEIALNSDAEQASRPKPYSVTEISQKACLATDDASAGINPSDEAVYRLELPLSSNAAPSPSAARPPALPFARISSDRALSILIVDDVAMNRDIAGSILRAAGYEVTCVAGGAEAIAAVKVKEFDAVLMDVRMPAMDGLEATRHIRELEGERGTVPIVALTAQDFPEQIAACQKAGMNGHVSKPFDPDKLAAAVVRAVESGSKQGRPLATDFMTVGAPAPSARKIGSEVPLIDFETFKRTASFIAPKMLASYLRKVLAVTKTLLVMLDGPPIPEYDSNEFAGIAHIVAGTAGMFGFERLTATSRQFERATESGTPDSAPLGDALSAAIKETLPEIRSRISAAADA